MNVRIPIEANISIVTDYPVDNPANRDVSKVSYECATRVYVCMYVCTCVDCATVYCVQMSPVSFPLQMTVTAEYRTDVQTGSETMLELWVILVIVACIVVFILLLGISIVVLYCVSTLA